MLSLISFRKINQFSLLNFASNPVPRRRFSNSTRHTLHAMLCLASTSRLALVVPRTTALPLSSSFIASRSIHAPAAVDAAKRVPRPRGTSPTFSPAVLGNVEGGGSFTKFSERDEEVWA